MTTIEQQIEIAVPVSTVYDQWTQFEEFPSFMDGILEVRQLDATHLHWRAEVAGEVRDWNAEIVEQHPDRCVAWRSTSGKANHGEVRFESLDPGRTLVTLEQDVELEGIKERVGDALGMIESRARGDLQRFRDMIEGRGVASGGWRHDVPQDAHATGAPPTPAARAPVPDPDAVTLGRPTTGTAPQPDPDQPAPPITDVASDARRVP
ncbi:MAG: SRPBCC family protein [Solirubrobacteraceae bacterium]|nr:SRPBCC family protein [Solirubrobacteraceae bacterium]